MQTAQNLATNINPIDMVENIFSAKAYEFDRRNINEVVVEVQGKMDKYVVVFCLGIINEMFAHVLSDGR